MYEPIRRRSNRWSRAALQSVSVSNSLTHPIREEQDQQPRRRVQTRSQTNQAFMETQQTQQISDQASDQVPQTSQGNYANQTEQIMDSETVPTQITAEQVTTPPSRKRPCPITAKYNKRRRREHSKLGIHLDDTHEQPSDVDQETGQPIDFITSDPIPGERLVRLRVNGTLRCYDSWTLKQIIDTQNRPKEPTSNLPLPSKIVHFIQNHPVPYSEEILKTKALAHEAERKSRAEEEERNRLVAIEIHNRLNNDMYGEQGEQDDLDDEHSEDDDDDLDDNMDELNPPEEPRNLSEEQAPPLPRTRFFASRDEERMLARAFNNARRTNYQFLPHPNVANNFEQNRENVENENTAAQRIGTEQFDAGDPGNNNQERERSRERSRSEERPALIEVRHHAQSPRPVQSPRPIANVNNRIRFAAPRRRQQGHPHGHLRAQAQAHPQGPPPLVFGLNPFIQRIHTHGLMNLWSRHVWLQEQAMLYQALRNSREDVQGQQGQQQQVQPESQDLQPPQPSNQPEAEIPENSGLSIETEPNLQANSSTEQFNSEES